jgi:hypothetical protein
MHDSAVTRTSVSTSEPLEERNVYVTGNSTHRCPQGVVIFFYHLKSEGLDPCPSAKVSKLYGASPTT